ncbi:MAG TPA: glycerophosphodiester phosphodiesterase [Microlunatus sp.]|nr:glycerophosphodiester phosphodiesterase [Microlunatus sp.]
MRSAEEYPYFRAPFLAFAHRGGAAYAPNVHRENTVHAFRQATALGYGYLETDVHPTRDGVLVAFHDALLDRVSGRSGRIEDLTAEQVADVRIGGVDPIPTMAELFETFPHARFNIDAKSDRSVDLLARLIAEHEAYDRVCVSSFGIARLHRLRQLLGPRVPSAVSILGVVANRFTPWVTRALNSPGQALQMPEYQRIAGRRVRAVTPGLVRTAHRAGKQVHVWTVDDAETMNRLIDLGVDGIFTDRIDTLKDVLQHRCLWNEPP